MRLPFLSARIISLEKRCYKWYNLIKYEVSYVQQIHVRAWQQAFVHKRIVRVRQKTRGRSRSGKRLRFFSRQPQRSRTRLRKRRSCRACKLLRIPSRLHFGTRRRCRQRSGCKKHCTSFRRRRRQRFDIYDLRRGGIPLHNSARTQRK